MSTPEERLRRLIDDERWNDRTPPSLDPGSRLARPQRRTGLVLAAAVVTVLVVAGVGVALGQFSHRQTNPAPTLPDKAVAVIPWKPTRPAPPADVMSPPVCNAGDLTAHSNGVAPAGGSWNMGIDVSNSGPLCSMPNSSVTLRTPADSGPDAILAKANEGEDGNSPELIAAHSSVNYHVTFGSSCQPTQAASVGDRRLSMAFAGTDVPVTGITVPPELASCLTVFLGEPETAVDEVDPYPQLTVSLALPSSAEAGSTLSYTATITNRWKKPFTFVSCPNYYQDAYVSRQGHVVTSYALNCKPMKALNQGQQATFAMRTRLPSTPGAMKLGWYLGYAGPSRVGTMILK